MQIETSDINNLSFNSDNEGSNELQKRDLKSKVNDNQEMDLDKLRHLVHCT